MPGLVPAVMGAIRARGLLDNVFIATTNNDAVLQEAMRKAPGARVALACVSRIREVGRAAIEELSRFDS